MIKYVSNHDLNVVLSLSRINDERTGDVCDLSINYGYVICAVLF